MRVAGDAIPRWRTRATWAAGHSAGDQMMCVYIYIIMNIYIYGWWFGPFIIFPYIDL